MGMPQTMAHTGYYVRTTLSEGEVLCNTLPNLQKPSLGWYKLNIDGSFIL